MIESIHSLSAGDARREPPERPEAPDSTQPRFSLAIAAASLEARAGAVLKAFGGAPTDGAAETFATDNSAGRQDARGGQAQAPSIHGDNSPDATSADKALQTRTPTTFTPDLVADSKSATTVAPKIAANQNTPIATAVLVGNPVAQRGAETAATNTAREGAPRGAGDVVRSAPAKALLPQAAQPQEFARLLARRLDAGATAFDIRLDPPDLGKVEARLIVGDEGKAALALKFDNQAAMDLFTRDEAALRAALAGAGFDLGGGDLAFSLSRENDPFDPSAIAAPRIAAPVVAEIYDPLFPAPFSDGVIDLRV